MTEQKWKTNVYAQLTDSSDFTAIEKALKNELGRATVTVKHTYGKDAKGNVRYPNFIEIALDSRKLDKVEEFLAAQNGMFRHFSRDSFAFQQETKAPNLAQGGCTTFTPSLAERKPNVRVMHTVINYTL